MSLNRNNAQSNTDSAASGNNVGGLHRPPPPPPASLMKRRSEAATEATDIALGGGAAAPPPPLPASAPSSSATDKDTPGQEMRVFGYTLATMSGLVLLIALFVDFQKLGTPSVCVFYNTTGLPCAGCGLSRGCCAIAQGRWEEAWQFNPFSFFFMPLFIIGFIGGSLTAWRPALRPVVLPRGIFMMRLTIALAIAMMIFGSWRLYTIVGWAGLTGRMRYIGSGAPGPPPAVLLHGDATIPRPAPGQ